MHRLLTRAAPALCLAALPFVALAACSDDKSTTSSSSSESQAPEDKISSDAAVATGLERMVTEAKEVQAAGTDQATAEAAYEEAHETWETIEGTVKQKEPDLYAQIEEDLTLLKSSAGDLTKAKTAAESLSRSVDAYLVKHPG